MNLRPWTMAAIVIVGGCGNESQDAEIGLLGSSVTGYLIVASGEPTQLCEALAESSPPTCQGETTIVNGLDPNDVSDLQSVGDIRWTSTPVTLYGQLADHGLTVPVDARGPGVTGRALAGPTCPVERAPPDPSCAPKSVANAELAVRNADGQVVTTVVTDVTGRFAVALEPGTYTIEPGRVEGFLEQADAITVTVTDAPVEIEVAYDTGIR